jgi:hypothetical protein
MARHSRVKSSTTFKIRKHRPLASVSRVKSIDHRSFGLPGAFDPVPSRLVPSFGTESGHKEGTKSKQKGGQGGAPNRGPLGAGSECHRLRVWCLVGPGMEAVGFAETYRGARGSGSLIVTLSKYLRQAERGSSMVRLVLVYVASFGRRGVPSRTVRVPSGFVNTPTSP